MNEAKLIEWLIQNWPSLIIGFTIAAVYVRLSRFVHRLTRLERSFDTLREIHVERHAEDGANLYREKGSDE